MKKTLVIIFLFIFFISCKKKEENFTGIMIEKLMMSDNELPSKYGSLNLYVTTNENEIHQTNNQYLFEFYKLYYYKKFKSFDVFLNEILNKTFVFDKRLFKKEIYLESFKLNPEIEKGYSEMGFDEFLKKYSKETPSKKGKLELNKSIIKTDEYSTILYLLYKNRYDVSIDCYLGKDYIRKRVDSFK